MPRALSLVLAVFTLAGPVLAYEPAQGYRKTGTSFNSSALAFSPTGALAIAADNPGGGATIRLYSSLADIGGEPLQTWTDPAWKFIGGVEFADPQTLIFAESGDQDALFRIDLDLPTGSAAIFAHVSNLNDLAVCDGFAYAVSAGGPGANDLVRVRLSDGDSTTVIDNYGTGYGGGVAIDRAGNILLTDTNDPFFVGNAGMIRRFDPAFAPLASIDLAPGGGSGAFDLAFDSEGDLFVSTGRTVTQVDADGQTVEPFGSFSDPFPFPTYLSYLGEEFEPGQGGGILLVGGFTEEGSFGITPTPEPSSLILLGGVLVLASGRKGGRR